MSIDSSTEKTSFFFPLFFTLGLGKGIFESRRQQIRIRPNTPVINGQILISIIKANSNRIIAEYGLFTEETEQEYRHLRPSTLSLVQCRQGQGSLLRLSKSPWDLFLPVYCLSGKGSAGEEREHPQAFLPSNYLSPFILQMCHYENITKYLTKMKVFSLERGWVATRGGRTGS